MDKRTLFQVDLGSFDLTDNQVAELEERLSKTTIEFLGSFKEGKEFVANAVAYKPNPDDPFPYPFPWPPLPRPWPRPFPGFFPIDRRRMDRLFIDVKKLQ
ncbi:MAG: hypothetical protein KDC80_24475 [Saprospiraceae bacterium]|nr:hypothetical protein [Saprospiraceae bacterium]